MCRIAAIISDNTSILEQSIQRMNFSMQRGGPDDDGILVDEGIGFALGHRRLSIIDLSNNGHQPMHLQNSSLSIVFNGEIYNYAEIREELMKKGCSFNSNSDTEVVLHGYKIWGEEVLQRLKGMFAFIIVNTQTKQIFAARDHVGIKPLYYSKQGNTIIIASEIKAFLAYNPNWEPNKEWPIWFLTYGFLPEPITTLSNVHTLPSGHFCTIYLETKQVITKAYYQLNYETKNNVTYSEAKAQTKALMLQSIKRHMVSDVPVGVFLSGGIDSSLLTILAQQQQSSPINTLSIYFDDEKFSEKEYQDIVIKQTGVKHHSFKVSKEDFLAEWEEIFKSLDQPSIDAINSHFICKYAHQLGLKVVLSGLGSDEIFGGYTSFQHVKKLKRYQQIAVVNKLVPIFSNFKYPLKKLEFLSSDLENSEYLFYRGLFTPSDVAKILNLPIVKIKKTLNCLPNLAQNITHPQNKVSFNETAIYMKGQLLKDSDTQSMWHSLELRVPFLDIDLMTYINQLPPYIKYNGKTPKNLLIDSFEDILDKRIWDRRKQGFSFPFQNWFKVMPFITQSNQIPQNNIKQFLANKITYSRLWAIYLVNVFSKTVTKSISITNPEILFVYLQGFDKTGGIESVNKNLIKAFTNNFNNKFAFWGLHDSLPDTRYCFRNNIVGFASNKIQFVKELFKNRNSFKHIIVGHINLAIPVFLLSLFNKKLKITVIAHGIEVWDTQIKFKSKLLKRADKIIAVSNFTKQKLIKNNSISENKIEVLHNSLDAFFEPNSIEPNIDYLKNRYKITENEKIVLTITRIDSKENYKGYDVVIDCLAEIKKENPEIKFKYILAGKYDDIAFSQIKSQLKQCNLENETIVSGFVNTNELRDHYKLADVFILPSSKEGFGIVFIEAIACGTPVIAGKGNGTDEALQFGKLGTLVNTQNQKEIKQALLNNLTKTNQQKNKLAHPYSFKEYEERVKQTFNYLLK